MLLEPRQRPPRVLGKIRIFGRGQRRKPRANFRVARLARAQTGISGGHAGVAQQPAPLRALHRAAAKSFAKLLFRGRQQPLQSGRKKGIAGERPRLEILQCGERRAAIPWTNILADVAAENVAPHRFAQFRGDFAAQLDGEVRDATPRIQQVRLDDRAGRTSVNAQAAISAQVGWRDLR